MKNIKRPLTRKKIPKKYLDQVGVLNVQRCKYDPHTKKPDKSPPSYLGYSGHHVIQEGKQGNRPDSASIRRGSDKDNSIKKKRVNTNV